MRVLCASKWSRHSPAWSPLLLTTILWNKYYCFPFYRRTAECLERWSHLLQVPQLVNDRVQTKMCVVWTPKSKLRFQGTPFPKQRPQLARAAHPIEPSNRIPTTTDLLADPDPFITSSWVFSSTCTPSSVSPGYWCNRYFSGICYVSNGHGLAFFPRPLSVLILSSLFKPAWSNFPKHPISKCTEGTGSITNEWPRTQESKSKAKDVEGTENWLCWRKTHTFQGSSTEETRNPTIHSLIQSPKAPPSALGLNRHQSLGDNPKWDIPSMVPGCLHCLNELILSPLFSCRVGCPLFPPTIVQGFLKIVFPARWPQPPGFSCSSSEQKSS